MVVLKNIKKTQHEICAEYYPEGKEPKGFMRMRISDGEVMEHEMSGMMSASHVRRELVRLAGLEKPPKEKTVLWY